MRLLATGEIARMMMFVLAPAVALPAVAQETAAPAAAPRPDVEVFEPGYFDRFSPANVEDMIRQVPGFDIQEGEDVRGFGGAAGNVLINGERPSTKTRLRTLLSRIPVSRVLRIEIVSGSSANLDMRGQTRVANVILKSGLVERSATWQTVARHYQGGRITGEVEGSATLPLLDGTLTVSAEYGQSMTGGPGGGTRAFGARAFFDGDGYPCNASIEIVGDGVQCEAHDGLILNERVASEFAFEYRRAFSWGKFNSNGTIGTSEYNGSRFFTVYANSFQGDIVRFEPQQNRFDGDGYDLSGDVEIPLLGGTLKLIAVQERNSDDGNNLFEFFNGAGAFSNSVFITNDSQNGETIYRGQYSHRVSASHVVEVSLESAYNFLDSSRRVTLNTGQDVTPAGSDTRVEEQRYEAQVSDVWTVSPTLRIEPGFKFEVSTISQEGRLSNAANIFTEREFTYPKPIVTATWSRNANQKLRLSFQRKVAQLNFGDFVSSVDVNQERVDAGNAELVPEQSWSLESEFEQKFWGDGRITFRGSFEEVEDVQDVKPVIPLGGTIADASDGPGNIGDGRRWSLGVNVSAPLDRFGLTNARLDFDGRTGSSEVADPVTGETRNFSNAFDRNWNVNFRQDFPAQSWSYGFRLSESNGGTAYRLEETFKRQRTDGDLSIFVETTRFAGLNIRVGYNDIFDPAFVSDRVIYDGPRSTGVPVERQRSQSANGPFAFIRINGTL